MAYKFKYNERPRSYSEEKHGDEDIPSAKAVRDTAVEERDGKIIKSRRQHVCGREYIVFAEFSFGGTQSTVDLMKQVINLEQDAKNISARKTGSHRQTNRLRVLYGCNLSIGLAFYEGGQYVTAKPKDHGALLPSVPR